MNSVHKVAPLATVTFNFGEGNKGQAALVANAGVINVVVLPVSTRAVALCCPISIDKVNVYFLVFRPNNACIDSCSSGC